MMANMNFGLENSLPSTTDWILNRIDAYKKQTYPKDHPNPKSLPKRNCSQQISCTPHKFGRRFTTHVRAVVYFPKNRKDATEEQGWHKNYFTSINIFSRRAKRNKKRSHGVDWQQKAYDTVPQSWIINCLKIYKIYEEVIKFIEQTMKNWRVELTAGGKSIAEVKIQSGIFQGDALSPLLLSRGLPLREEKWGITTIPPYLN